MFNGVVGFDFVLMLDEAARNETLGSVSAVSRASAIAMVRDTSRASDFVSLSKTCMDGSTIIFENANDAYRSGERAVVFKDGNRVGQTDRSARSRRHIRPSPKLRQTG
jgi:hypothetical protein